MIFETSASHFLFYVFVFLFLLRIEFVASCVNKKTHAKSASMQSGHEMQAAAVFYDSGCVGVEGVKNRVEFTIMETSCASFFQQELHQATEKAEREASFWRVNP